MVKSRLHCFEEPALDDAEPVRLGRIGFCQVTLAQIRLVASSLLVICPADERHFL